MKWNKYMTPLNVVLFILAVGGISYWIYKSKMKKKTIADKTTEETVDVVEEEVSLDGDLNAQSTLLAKNIVQTPYGQVIG